jgi:hypothetical protein
VGSALNMKQRGYFEKWHDYSWASAEEGILSCIAMFRVSTKKEEPKVMTEA